MFYTARNRLSVAYEYEYKTRCRPRKSVGVEACDAGDVEEKREVFFRYDILDEHLHKILL